MYTERYLPKKYRDSRRRRRRNRLRRTILIAVLIVALIVGAYFLFKWFAGGPGPVVLPSSTPPASSGFASSAGESPLPSVSPSETAESTEAT